MSSGQTSNYRSKERSSEPARILRWNPKTGTYKYSPVSEYNIEGIISYKSGYTQVAGHPSSRL